MRVLKGGVLLATPENSDGEITRWDSTPDELCECNGAETCGGISAYEVDELKPAVTTHE